MALESLSTPNYRQVKTSAGLSKGIIPVFCVLFTNAPYVVLKSHGIFHLAKGTGK
jgi:hypothetical protein